MVIKQLIKISVRYFYRIYVEKFELNTILIYKLGNLRSRSILVFKTYFVIYRTYGDKFTPNLLSLRFIWSDNPQLVNLVGKLNKKWLLNTQRKKSIVSFPTSLFYWINRITLKVRSKARTRWWWAISKSISKEVKKDYKSPPWGRFL